jgi:hypothetical protein
MSAGELRQAATNKRLLAEAQVELVEQDGRVFTLKRLPAAGRPPGLPGRRYRGGKTAFPERIA